MKNCLEKDIRVKIHVKKNFGKKNVGQNVKNKLILIKLNFWSQKINAQNNVWSKKNYSKSLLVPKSWGRGNPKGRIDDHPPEQSMV